MNPIHITAHMCQYKSCRDKGSVVYNTARHIFLHRLIIYISHCLSYGEFNLYQIVLFHQYIIARLCCICAECTGRSIIFTAYISKACCTIFICDYQRQCQFPCVFDLLEIRFAYRYCYGYRLCKMFYRFSVLFGCNLHSIVFASNYAQRIIFCDNTFHIIQDSSTNLLCLYRYICIRCNNFCFYLRYRITAYIYALCKDIVGWLNYYCLYCFPTIRNCLICPVLIFIKLCHCTDHIRRIFQHQIAVNG